MQGISSSLHTGTKRVLKGIRELSTIEHGEFIDFPQVLFQILLGHPASLLLVAVATIFWKHYRIIKKFPAALLNLLKIMSLSWIGGLILWLILFDPLVNTRYVIGFVFLTLLLIVIITILLLHPIFIDNHQKWQNWICGIALLLTLSVSHSDVDYQQAKYWISSESLHQQWVTSSSLAKVQDYLNKNTSPQTRVLFYYTTQRFHANFIVYGARSFSPRTRFVYSNEMSEIKEGMKRINPEFYVIRKDKIGNSGGLLAKSLSLMKI